MEEVEEGVQTSAVGASWASCGLHRERDHQEARAAYHQVGSKGPSEGTGRRVHPGAVGVVG